MEHTRILITGATGLVGANSVRHFLEQGFEVRILIRNEKALPHYLLSRCEVVKGDLTDKDQVSEAVKGCRWVLHAASQVHDTAISMDTYMTVNYEGTQNMVNACLQHGTEKMVYISTASIINGGTRENPATELNDFELVHLHSGYLYSKYLAHQYVQEQVTRSQLNAVILSPTFILGDLDLKPSSGKLLLHANNKKVVLAPPGRKHFVHVKDVVNAINQAFEHAEKGAHYLLANDGMSYKGFYMKLRELSGEQHYIITLPKWLLLAGGILGSFYSYLVKKKVPLTYEAAYLLCVQSYYSNEKSVRELGLAYQSLQDTLTDALNWFAGTGAWLQKESSKSIRAFSTSTKTAPQLIDTK